MRRFPCVEQDAADQEARENEEKVYARPTNAEEVLEPDE